MTFLSWLVDDNCFHIESDNNAWSHDKARKRIAVAEMIISLHKNNFTPFNLGCSNKLVIFIFLSFQYLKLRYGLCHFFGVKSS
jgi:hypothetical protein